MLAILATPPATATSARPFAGNDASSVFARLGTFAPRLEAAQARIGAARAAASSGTVEGALSAALRAAGLSPASSSVPRRPSLRDAVEDATAALRARAAEWAAAEAEADPFLRPTLELRDGDDDVMRGARFDPPALGPRTRALQIELAAHAMELARAADAFITEQPRAIGLGDAVVGCDVVNLVPTLCVGSSAANEYVEDVALLVDLGGDDVYRNSAGGAPFERDGKPFPVSVVIDFRGNDSYVGGGRSFPGGFAGSLSATQGAAGSGSVGMLVDLEGNDLYAAATGSEVRLTLAAQGASYGGIGLLLDGQGSDRYSVAASDRPAVAEYVVAQGATSGGLAAMVDTGAGDDVRAVDGGRARQSCPFPCASGGADRFVYAQGGAVSGAAVLVDDGGRDSFDISVAASWIPEPADPWNGVIGVDNAGAAVIAQGGAFAGIAMLLAGRGDSTYSIESDNEGSTMSPIWAQGGANTGIGALDDLGGDDVYSARAVSRSPYRFDLLDGCDPCIPPPVRSLPKGERYQPHMPIVHVVGQGGAQGSTAQTGILADHSGADTFTATNEFRTDVALADRRAGATSPATVAAATGLPFATLVAQGGTIGLEAVGVLVDHAGPNRFTASLLHRTTVRGRSTDGAPEPHARAQALTRIGVGAQGGGAWSSFNSAAALFDLGGPSRFEASSLVEAESSPNDDTLRRGFPLPAFHGSAPHVALALLVAAGDRPHILSRPAHAVCAGARGSTAWAECPPVPAAAPATTAEPVDTDGGGWGIAPGASLRPEIRFHPLGALADATGVHAAARVVDDQGFPVAGATVHFDTQVESVSLTRSWLSEATVDAVTDETGEARAVLPLPSGRTRVLVTYDGDGVVAPAHVTMPVQT